MIDPDAGEEERCIVGWIATPESDDDNSSSLEPYQLVALTYTGGWYRLALPTSGTATHVADSAALSVSPLSASPPSVAALSMHRPRSSSGSSFTSRPSKGKEREKDAKESRECVLKEYRRYGRWDGWG